MRARSLTRRRFLASTAASAAVVAMPHVRGAHAAGSLSVGFWDHWVPGANGAMTEICQAWAAQEKVDLRIVTLEVPAQEAITRDNVTVKVNAVVYFRVVDPEEAVVKVIDYIRATSLIGQTTLRSILASFAMIFADSMCQTASIVRSISCRFTVLPPRQTHITENRARARAPRPSPTRRPGRSPRSLSPLPSSRR